MPVSITGVGAIITILEAILPFVGIEVPDGSVAAAVNGVVQAVGFVLIVWGQLRRKDLVAGIIRK